MKINVKEILTDYENNNGHSLFAGIFEMLTFVKSIPLYIAMSLAISLSLLIGINVATWMFMNNWVLSLLLTPVSIGIAVYLSITGFFYFTVTSLIENLQNIVLGTIDPIEKVYWKWHMNNHSKMTKREFVILVLKEEVFPSLFNNIILRRFKSRMAKIFEIVISDVDQKNKKWNEDIAVM